MYDRRSYIAFALSGLEIAAASTANIATTTHISSTEITASTSSDIAAAERITSISIGKIVGIVIEHLLLDAFAVLAFHLFSPEFISRCRAYCARFERSSI